MQKKRKGALSWYFMSFGKPMCDKKTVMAVQHGGQVWHIHEQPVAPKTTSVLQCTSNKTLGLVTSAANTPQWRDDFYVSGLKQLKNFTWLPPLQPQWLIWTPEVGALQENMFTQEKHVLISCFIWSLVWWGWAEESILSSHIWCSLKMH